ncbi:hypothetical protein MMPV_009672 [Pyropia vietnamensis]
MPLRDVTVPLPVAAAAAVASAAVAVAAYHLAAPSADGGIPPPSTSPPAASTGTAASTVASPSAAPAPAAADATATPAASTTTTTATASIAVTAPISPPPSQPPLADGWLVGVELGGTTCVAACSRLSDPTVVVNRLELPTATPADTLPALVAWVAARVAPADGVGGGKRDDGGGGGDEDGGDPNLDGAAVAPLPLLAIGVASFGPLVVDPGSAAYGCIRHTPKVAWRGVNVLDPFRRFDVPLGLDTDVNAPALAELRYGQHGTATNIAYITVGTGIGVGAVVNGAPLHGLLHPEAGHLPVRPHPNDAYKGCLATHASGVESMACSRALADRVGGPSFPVGDLPGVPDEHPVWTLAAHYLGGLVISLTYVLSPQVVVLSGGVVQRPGLVEAVRAATVAANEGYLDVPALTLGGIDAYVVRSRFGNAAGVVGALEVGRRALEGRREGETGK